MLRLATDDNDAAVRTAAEAEIARLDPDRLLIVSKLVEESLRNQPTRKTAYAFIGRLRIRGVRLPSPRILTRSRLYLAFSLWRSLYPDSVVRLWLRGFWSVSLAAIVASVLIGFFLHSVFRSVLIDDSAVYGAGFVSYFIAVLLALISISRAVPLGLRADPLAALAVDVAAIAFAILGPVLFGGLNNLALITEARARDHFVSGNSNLSLRRNHDSAWNRRCLRSNSGSGGQSICRRVCGLGCRNIGAFLSGRSSAKLFRRLS